MAGRPAIWSCSTTSPNWPSSTAQLPPAELLKGYRAAFINPNSKLLGPKFKFARHGQCGAELAELLPHLATVADDIAIVRSMVDRRFQSRAGPDPDEHRQPAVRPAQHRAPGSPMAWGASRTICRPSSSFQLRQERPQRRQLQLGQRLFADRLSRRAVPQQRRAGSVSVEPARRRRAAAARFARRASRTSTSIGSTRSAIPKSPRGSTRFEMAYRMQASAPELMDLSQEPPQTLAMYGAEPGKPSFANNCLWPGGWSSAASASCNSSTRPGTSTATWWPT